MLSTQQEIARAGLIRTAVTVRHQEDQIPRCRQLGQFYVRMSSLAARQGKLYNFKCVENSYTQQQNVFARSTATHWWAKKTLCFHRVFE